MIKAVNLGRTYYQGKTKIEAVRDVNLEVLKGESVFITGPSGAGKSTLLHLLGGLDKPTKGTVLFNKIDFYSLSDRARSKVRNENIGFVFQFYHLLPEFSVLENVILPALVGRKKIFRKRRDIQKRAEELLDIVGLSARKKHRPSELSGGESQRTAIARALVNFPAILLCDEPTGNLDSKMGEEIFDYLWMLREKEKMALVIVTHDEESPYEFDKRFRIRDGIIEGFKDESQGLSRWQIYRQREGKDINF